MSNKDNKDNKDNNILKAVIEINYRSYVMDAGDALQVLETLARAERYTTKYWSSTASHTKHVWSDGEELPTLQIMSPDAYRIAKAAGKPDAD